MSYKYYFLVGPTVTVNTDAPSTLFIYETENDDDKGKYTAYHRNKELQEDWESWLNRQYFPPYKFVNRFGYSPVDAGPLRGEEHFQELLRKAGIVNRDTVKGKVLAWVETTTKDFLSNAPTIEFKEGGYTKPELRERIKNRIMAGSKGGNPGQWSARKAQLLALEYRKAGGGYTGKPRKTQRSLKKWTREKWTTSDGKPAIRKGGTRRYLPASAWSRLTPAQRTATNRKKIQGSNRGNQFVGNTEKAKNAGRNARKT
jgi:hypothetical protein